MRLLLFALLLLPFFAAAQTINPALVRSYWPARWIAHPTTPGKQYGVFHFRKTVELEKKPGTYVIHVSADNRYRLYVNGALVCEGPARSDTQHWYYETVDLAPYLKSGTNTLAALVWNGGENAPFAQMSFRSAFLVQGDTDAEKAANTDDKWKVLQDNAYQAEPLDMAKMQTYMVVGDGDRIDGNTYPWGWEQPGFNDSQWTAARTLWAGTKPRGLGSDGNWMLVPSPIPQMERFDQRMATMAPLGETQRASPFLKGEQSLTIPAHATATFLIDQGHLTNAYPQLVISKGKNTAIRITYAEALVDDKRQKGNRNDITGKHIIGMSDVFVGDGGDMRRFSPLWFRTFRYIQLDIKTGDEPLTLNDYYGLFTGYPLQEKAQFVSSDPSLKKIWETGWRTARLCAGETYFDCPYYEQLQYTGDTRVQSFISLYVSGDDRLMRKALTDYDHSRIPDGLTQSRYPCNDMQVIPTFSLFWVSMIHDYSMLRNDEAFVKLLLPGVESVLKWHEDRLAANGMNGALDWWNFVDWAWPWVNSEGFGGVPDGAHAGGSAILSLQFAYTLQQAAELFENNPPKAAHYRSLAQKITSATYRLCWDKTRGLLADIPDKSKFSQHANIWGVLTDAIPKADQKTVLQRIMEDKSIRQATFYFKFYLFQALKKTGMGDAFLPQLKPWHDMVANGLSTFAEEPDPTRSDCHAWSSSPVYEFLSTVCGINPGAKGFREVKIIPYLGDLSTAEGAMPHPDGMIRVKYKKLTGNGLEATIELPGKLTGEMEWKGQKKRLNSGSQVVIFK
jgi:alpha-L-rhamnosidase